MTRAGVLSQTLEQNRAQAMLFRTLATLRTDISLFDDVDELRWPGPTAELEALAKRFDIAAAESSSR